MSSYITSSEKWPLAIGFFLAVIVLVGLCMFMLAVNESMLTLGGEGLKPQIRKQKEEIEGLKREVSALETAKQQAAALERTYEDYKRVKAENQALAVEVKSLGEQSAAETDALQKLLEEFENYKDQYRAHVREKAKGTEMAELKTRGGDTYTNITIREVTPVGIQIRHADGTKRIPYEDLPIEMQDYLQFDSKQKDLALQNERAALDTHMADVLAAKTAVKAEAAGDKIRSEEERIQKINQAIVQKTAQIQNIQNEVSSLRADIVTEENKKIRRNEVHDRVGGLSRAPAIRLEIQKKEAQINTLRQQIAQLNQSLQK